MSKCAGKVASGLYVHPNKEQLVYPLGSSLILERIAGKKSQQFLIGDNNAVSCVAVSKSGRLVASGTSTHQGYQVRLARRFSPRQAEIIVWEYKTLKEKFRFKLHKVKVQALSFSASEKYLVSMGGQVHSFSPVLPRRTMAVLLFGISKKGLRCAAPLFPQRRRVKGLRCNAPTRTTTSL
jgi:hypothetical protein